LVDLKITDCGISENRENMPFRAASILASEKINKK